MTLGPVNLTTTGNCLGTQYILTLSFRCVVDLYPTLEHFLSSSLRYSYQELSIVDSSKGSLHVDSHNTVGAGWEQRGRKDRSRILKGSLQSFKHHYCKAGPPSARKQRWVCLWSSGFQPEVSKNGWLEGRRGLSRAWQLFWAMKWKQEAVRWNFKGW